MLDHLSHAFHTFPVFALVGMKDKPIRPTAVEDVVQILHACLVDGRLSQQTVAVTGSEELELGEAVRRVATVVGRRPLFVRMPLWFHYALGWFVERLMTIPLVSIAQVRILSEGIVKPLPTADDLPDDLQPVTRFTEQQIRKGLPQSKRFGLADLRWRGPSGKAVVR